MQRQQPSSFFLFKRYWQLKMLEMAAKSQAPNQRDVDDEEPRRVDFNA